MFGGAGTRGGGRSNFGEVFANPFLDMATLATPSSFRNVLYWSEHLYSRFGTYAMAMERVISYFITDIELDHVSDDEEDKWRELLNGPLDTRSVLQSLLRDRAAYGNAFASIIRPFRRFLGCGKCASFWSLNECYNNSTFKFSFSGNCEFRIDCPSCRVGSGYRGPARVKDLESDDEQKIKIKRWSPHQIDIIHHAYSDDCQYIWRIPEEDKRNVRSGRLFDLERTPKGVIEAIRDNKVYRFDQDAIFHMKEPYLSGQLNRGWGLPRILLNFGQVFYVQVLRRANEAIAMDYVIPFRILTPAQRSVGSGGVTSDPLRMFDGGDLRSMLRSVLTARRRDPAGFHVLPFPVEYQMLGAEATKLAPRELLDQANESLLNDVGVPVELYKGTLQLQTAPVALRLFESTWHHVVHDANSFLGWVVEQISQLLSWEAVKATLKRVTLADDVQEQLNALQLFMSQQLSGTSAFKAIGRDWKSEQKRIAEESIIQARIQSRTQEEMEQAGFAQQIAKGMTPGAGGGAPPGGGMPPGGAPPAGAAPTTAGAMGAGVPMAGPVSGYLQSMSPNVPQTPQDMKAVATQLAQELLGLPEGQKDSELRKLKQSNSFLHQLVRGEIDRIRQETKSQAGNAAMAQMQQGGGQPPM